MKRRTFLHASIAVPLTDLPAGAGFASHAPGAEWSRWSRRALSGSPFGEIYVRNAVGKSSSPMTDVVERFGLAICQRYWTDFVLDRADREPINIRQHLRARAEPLLH